jgi:hypothetical protein
LIGRWLFPVNMTAEFHTMANNYLQFSEAIGHLSIAERDWLQRQLETVYLFGEIEYAEHEIPDDLSAADATWCGCRAFRDLPDFESDDDAGFQYEFQEDEELGRHFWVYADEGGDPDRVAHLAQKFLRQFRPRESWSLTYATTCSKLRLGEFGGGAYIVTAGSVESFDATDFVSARRAASAN